MRISGEIGISLPIWVPDVKRLSANNAARARLTPQWVQMRVLGSIGWLHWGQEIRLGAMIYLNISAIQNDKYFANRYVHNHILTSLKLQVALPIIQGSPGYYQRDLSKIKVCKISGLLSDCKVD
jgi:hypothetical protein